MSKLGKDAVDGEEAGAEGEAVLGDGDAELVDALLGLFDDEEGDAAPAQEAGFGSDEQRKAVFANLADQGAEGHGSRFRIARLPAVTKIIKNIKFLRKAISSKKWRASDKPMTKGELVSARASYRRAVGELRSTVAEYADDGFSGAKGAYKAAGIGEAEDGMLSGDVIRAGGFGEAEEAAIAGDFIPLVERAVRADSTIPVKIIQPGWGSSGHYSADVLKRDGPKVFRKGTKMFWNHQTPADEAARPEGDLRDLAGEFVSDAVWKDDGLYAEAKVFAPYREAVNELAPHIGVSIRALGRAKAGEADGRKGNLIEQIVAAKSVDFVTTPGAGGKVLELFESARRAPESREVENVEEVKRLTEANAALEAEKAALLQENARLVERLLLGEARGVVAEALGKADLPDVTKARLAEALAKNPPAKDGKLDAEAFATRIAEAIKAEQEYIGKIVGAGRITGMGGGAPAEDAAGAQSRLAEAFKGLGLNEQAAKRAADGRF